MLDFDLGGKSYLLKLIKNPQKKEKKESSTSFSLNHCFIAEKVYFIIFAGM